MLTNCYPLRYKNLRVLTFRGILHLNSANPQENERIGIP